MKTKSKSKTKCPFCPKMLGKQGRHNHMRSAHPGKVGGGASQGKSSVLEALATSSSTRGYIESALMSLAARKAELDVEEAVLVVALDSLRASRPIRTASILPQAGQKANGVAAH